MKTSWLCVTVLSQGGLGGMARALTMRLDERKLQARANTQVLLLAQKKQGLFLSPISSDVQHHINERRKKKQQRRSRGNSKHWTQKVTEWNTALGLVHKIVSLNIRLNIPVSGSSREENYERSWMVLKLRRNNSLNSKRRKHPSTAVCLDVLIRRGTTQRLAFISLQSILRYGLSGLLRSVDNFNPSQNTRLCIR